MSGTESRLSDWLKAPSDLLLGLSDPFVEHWRGLMRWAGAYIFRRGEARERSDQLFHRSELVRGLLPTLDRDGAGLILAQHLGTQNRILSYALWSKNDLDALNFNTDVLFSKQGPMPKLPADIAGLVAKAKTAPSAELDVEIRNRLKAIFEDGSNDLMHRYVSMRHSSYVGTEHEKQAFASGLLANIRARAWGLPDVETARESFGRPKTLSSKRDSYTNYVNWEIDRAYQDEN